MAPIGAGRWRHRAPPVAPIGAGRWRQLGGGAGANWVVAPIGAGRWRQLVLWWRQLVVAPAIQLGCFNKRRKTPGWPEKRDPPKEGGLIWVRKGNTGDKSTSWAKAKVVCVTGAASEWSCTIEYEEDDFQQFENIVLCNTVIERHGPWTHECVLHRISRRETGHSGMTKYQIEDGARHSLRVSGAGGAAPPAGYFSERERTIGFAKPSGSLACVSKDAIELRTNARCE
eukprot:COSAG02_NODE_2725_length_8156_cov_3.067271_5_plen_228_part_00